MTRARLAIGPALHHGSWAWVGADMVDSLARHYEVEVFPDLDDLPPCDVAVVVKNQALGPKAEEIARRGTRIVYLPVDFYETEEQLHADAALLSACSAVVIHCERLRPVMEAYCGNVWPIDHYNKYGLDPPAAYRRDGFILWVGQFHYLPYLLEWACACPLPLPLVLLSNPERPRTVRRGREVAARLGIDIELSDGSVNGYRLVTWSPDAQRSLMAEAKAAIDIKGADSFEQITKPPTKAQKYVMSGLSLSVNADSYSYDYLRGRGLQPATPDDVERWFSEEYWRETNALGRRLREELTLEAVAGTLRSYIERVL